MERLVSFNHDPSLYLTPLPASDHKPVLDKGHLDPGERGLTAIQQTTESRSHCSKVQSDTSAFEEQLLSVVTRFTCFSNWSPDLTLLDLGATSFDVVRIADAVEAQFRECCQLPSLTQVLLTKKFREVVDYVCAELSDGESGGVSDSGDREERGVFQSQKRGRQGDFDIPPPKRNLSPPSNLIHVWRRGQTFCNGQ